MMCNSFVDYDDDGNEIHECWQCSGTGSKAGCFEDTCCGMDCDPEEPEYCCAPSRCDICMGKGSYAVIEKAEKTEEISLSDTKEKSR